MAAASEGHESCVALLINAKAELDLQENVRLVNFVLVTGNALITFVVFKQDNRSALHIACLKGKNGVLKLLLRANANYNLLAEVEVLLYSK